MSIFTRRKFVHCGTGAAIGIAIGKNGVPDPKAAPAVITSILASEDWQPDGNLKKAEWSHSAPVQFDQDAFSDARYPDFTTKVASCWTANYLYLAFWCPYRELTVYQGEDVAIERWGLWERDVVEAFINPAPKVASHYYEFEVAPTNQWLDLEIDLSPKPLHNAAWNSGFEHATRIDSATRVWTAEMRIPAVSMRSGEICLGEEWKVNFYRCDGPGADRVRRMMSWGRLPIRVQGGSFHQPGSFGSLRFSRQRATR